MGAVGASKHDSDGVLATSLERSVLWRIKLYLQFTGWLLYIINVVAAVPFLLVAAIAWLVARGPTWFFWVPFALGALVLANVVFDLCTVRWNLRPSESLPTRRDGLDVFDLMRARRSCRSYQARDLTPEHRAEIFDAVRRYTQRDQCIDDAPIRLEYVAAPLTVWPTVGGHEFFVAIAPKKYNRLAVIDVARSLQKVVLHATRMGLGTCWIGPGADQRSVAACLGDRFNPNEDHVICVCAIGYASWFKPMYIRLMNYFTQRRLPLKELFFANADFSAPLDVEAPPFASYGRCYEVCQWSPSSYNSQTTRCAAVIDERRRLIRLDFCASTHSRYYAAVAVGIWCANWEMGCEALGRRGHWEVLSTDVRGVSGAPALPQYDLSWVVTEGDAPDAN